MKAIQVRYMPCTNTKPARLKVWAHGLEPVYTSDTSSASVAATVYAHKYSWLGYNNWTEKETKLASGTLPNGDECFVLIEVPCE